MISGTNEMLSAQQDLIRREVAEGTGAAVELEVLPSSPQSGIRVWFSDLGRARSPIVELRPKGLKRYQAVLRFGTTAGQTIAQMQEAQAEDVQLARALVRSVSREAEVHIAGQEKDDWLITDGNFTLSAEVKGLDNRFDPQAITSTCRAIVIPILAAMAELYGYDPVDELDPAGAGEVEGAIRVALVRKRERNPRNRLLCLRIHGSICSVCGLDPQALYGDAGSVIEVHHLQPLSTLDGPRAYDPETDLIPLCPTCHRAAHSRRPIPWSPQELIEKLKPHE